MQKVSTTQRIIQDQCFLYCETTVYQLRFYFGWYRNNAEKNKFQRNKTQNTKTFMHFRILNATSFCAPTKCDDPETKKKLNLGTTMPMRRQLNLGITSMRRQHKPPMRRRQTTQFRTRHHLAILVPARCDAAESKDKVN